MSDEKLQWPHPIVCPKCFKESTLPATLSRRPDGRIDVWSQCDNCTFRWVVTVDGPAMKRKPDRRKTGREN
jgi:hypothetical protein